VVVNGEKEEGKKKTKKRRQETGQTYRHRTRMVQIKIQMQVEANHIPTGRDLSRLGLAAMSPGTLVAAEILRVDPVVVVRHEPKVVFTDVLVGAGADTVEHQVREEKVGRCNGQLQGQSHGRGDGGEMHLETGDVRRKLEKCQEADERPLMKRK